jgi:outer membrane lipase/esterase
MIGLNHGLPSIPVGWIVLGLALLIAEEASATPVTFSNLYFFGDSTTDTGNAGNLPDQVTLPDGRVVDLPQTQGPPPGLGYYVTDIGGIRLGRFTNGPVWAETFASRLGLSATAAIAGGTNYAVAGARTTDLELQLGVFRSQVPAVDPNALYTVWLGGNDILAVIDQETDITMTEAAGNVLAGIRTLEQAGAHNFLVPLLPNTGLNTRLSPEEGALATLLTEEFNANLRSGLNRLEEAFIFTPDLFAIVNNIVASPSEFGITEIETPCLNDPACRANPQGNIANRFFLFDNAHATTAVHTIVGNQIASVFVPEPSGLTVSIPGLIALVVMMWRRTT